MLEASNESTRISLQGWIAWKKLPGQEWSIMDSLRIWRDILYVWTRIISWSAPRIWCPRRILIRGLQNTYLRNDCNRRIQHSYLSRRGPPSIFYNQKRAWTSGTFYLWSQKTVRPFSSPRSHPIRTWASTEDLCLWHRNSKTRSHSNSSECSTIQAPRTSTRSPQRGLKAPKKNSWKCWPWIHRSRISWTSQCKSNRNQ